MSATAFLPHQVRTTPQDLEALARLWRWEGAIREHLPRVLASGDTTILFQAIFDLRGKSQFLKAYEALARFPTAGNLPTGLWFSVAYQIGLGMDLELATGHKAMELAHRLPDDTLLFVNASPAVAPILVDSAPREVTSRLVFDLPYAASTDPQRSRVSAELRSRGVGIALDDNPVAEGSPFHIGWGGERPDYLKVDVATGAEDEGMRIGLERAADWCRAHGVTLIAKRVGNATDLHSLRDLGVDWAQGYGLACPIEF